MPSKFESFFSNGGYATWFQSLIVVASVAVAVYAIRETDSNVAVSNAVGLAQRYFTEKPTLAGASYRLRVSQFEQVQEAKKEIEGYDPQQDSHFDRLFEVARPLVRKQIANTRSLQDDYNAVNDFFSAVFICVQNGVCDQAASVKLLWREVLGFYNATCPYMEESGPAAYNNDDSTRYVAFLVSIASLKAADKSKFFCRDELARYATR